MVYCTKNIAYYFCTPQFDSAAALDGLETVPETPSDLEDTDAQTDPEG